MTKKRTLACIFSLFLVLPFFSTPAYTQDWLNDKPSSAGPYAYDENIPDLLNIVGLTYHKARPIIIAAGWSPVQTLQKGTDDFEMTATYGEGKIFWDKGYHEVEACTGSGMAYCALNFRNKNDDQLRIVTRGEEWPESSAFAKVAGYRFTPRN